MRYFFILIFAILISAHSTEKPNIIFIIADDCTFRDMEIYGGQAKTPNLNKLASEGMKFEKCFQTAPMCSPTRHNIYTGLYPVKSGAYPNHTFAYDHVKSIVHYLEPLGYDVYQSGKRHFAPDSVFPFKKLGAGSNPDMKKINELFKKSSMGNKPFALFACSNEPHTPWTKGDASAYPPKEIKLPPYIVDTPEVRADFSCYLAEITYYDSQVGMIMKMLEENNLVENTMLMVVSEQGNAFPFAKWTCYDNGLQSAMVVRWPGQVKEGSVSQAMVEYVDITPTFIDAAGSKKIKEIDGESFLNVLKGETDEHKEFVYGLMTTKGIINGSDAYGIRSIRSESFKLILNLNHENDFTNACTKSKYFKSMEEKAKSDSEAKLLVDAYKFRPAIEFYDIKKDPLERNNLAKNLEYSSQIRHLKQKLTAWMSSQGDEGVPTELKAYERQKRKKKRK